MPSIACWRRWACGSTGAAGRPCWRRFLPGTRLPLSLAAGALGRSAGTFALWTALAALFWVPPLVILTALLGDAVARPFSFLVGPGSPSSS
jgi:hypothetical protein